MTTVLINDSLAQQLINDAGQEDQSIDELVEEIIENHFHRRNREKIERESQAYEQLHPELVQKHFGHWVAIHNGELVDFDKDRVALYRRIRAKFGKISVLLRQVREQPIEEIWIRSPRLEEAQ